MYFGDGGCVRTSRNLYRYTTVRAPLGGPEAEPLVMGQGQTP